MELSEFKENVFDGQFLVNDLHKAVESNDCERLCQLIEAGHSVNREGIDLIRPLHEACFRGYQECVRILLENGAEVRHPQTGSDRGRGKSPSDWVRSCKC